MIEELRGVNKKQDAEFIRAKLTLEELVRRGADERQLLNNMRIWEAAAK